MAQYHPFVLQVHRPVVGLRTSGHTYTQVAETADVSGGHSESSTSKCACDWRKAGFWQIVSAILGLLAAALLVSILAFGEGRLNTWTNTKSMHYTRDKNTWSWVSIFPSQVYTNQDPAAGQQWYKTVDGVMQRPAHAANPTEIHGFQIAGGFGILTNISSSVYISTLVVIYVLSLLDSVVLGVEHKDKKLEKPIYFTWVTVMIGVVFVVVHIFQKFGTWHDVTWGAGTQKVPVRFSWEAGASLFYAIVVLTMYILHLNVKNGVWHSLLPAGIETEYKSTKETRMHWLHVGSEEHGPTSKEASVVFAVAYFLLMMGLLGDTRSTVLETEAQLVILCVVGLSVLTLFAMRVRVYFEWVNVYFMASKDIPEHHTHGIMIEFVLKVADFIAIAVSCVLFGVAFNVLAVMFDSQRYNLLYVTVLIVMGMFLLARIAELLSSVLLRASSSTSWSWHHVYFAHYVGSITIILCVLFAFLFFENHGHDKLRKLESIQYMGMKASDVAANAKCQSNAVQNNKLLYDFLDVKNDQKFDDITPGLENPVSFKVFAWTRWWQFELRSTTGKQSPALFFCSNGLEQEFGLCAKEYLKRPGVEFEEDFQKTVVVSRDNNLV
jgi:hypothetical protein